MKDALALAYERIESHHRRQLPADERYTDAIGAELGHRWTAIASAGLYVPGGKASYPSSVLMNAMAAKVAGVPRLVMAVPTPGGEVNPAVLGAAHLAGIVEVYRIGGAQADRSACLWHGEHRTGCENRRPWQCLRRRGQAAGFRSGGHRYDRRPVGGRGGG